MNPAVVSEMNQTEHLSNCAVSGTRSHGKATARLIYFSPFSFGGLADYAHEQASALCEIGVDVCFLTTPRAMEARPLVLYDRKPILLDEPNRTSRSSSIARRVRSMRYFVGNIQRLSRCIRREQVGFVLFGAYFEYFAPLWAPLLQRLARAGCVFGSVVHDPLRNFVVGPPWWHRWSTACGYSFLREAFIHETIQLPTVKPMPRLRTTVVPHGPYAFPSARRTRAEIRDRLRIPESANLLLAFGHIRDNKNIDLVLEALRRCPGFYLLVAGREIGAAQRPAGYYQMRAAELGVADRCRWEIRHIPEDEVGDYFAASDLVLLTYGASFSSASGVLNAAIHFRKPCLASGGRSNLQTVVEKYSLGLWVEPDSRAEIERGLQRWLREKPVPNWRDYGADNSWKRNAQLVTERMLGSRFGISN